MSEVTAKDLREVLESTKFYHWDKEEVTQNKSKQLNYLAAFDAMAEKAEAYDRIMSTRYAVYFAQTEEDAKTIDYALAKLGYKPTPAEALKAVTE